MFACYRKHYVCSQLSTQTIRRRRTARAKRAVLVSSRLGRCPLAANRDQCPSLSLSPALEESPLATVKSENFTRTNGPDSTTLPPMLDAMSERREQPVIGVILSLGAPRLGATNALAQRIQRQRQRQRQSSSHSLALGANNWVRLHRRRQSRRPFKSNRVQLACLAAKCCRLSADDFDQRRLSRNEDAAAPATCCV